MNAELHTANGRRVLQIRPTDICRTYGVMIRFDDKTRIHYETEVSQLPDAEEGFLFLVDRKQVYINNHAPDLMIDRLADDLGKLLYPVILDIDGEGMISDIVNVEEIKNRWIKQKDYLCQYYEGAVAKDAFEKTEQFLRNPDMILDALEQDWFLGLFFSGIYGIGSYDFRQPVKIFLPVVPYAPLTGYDITREITEQHTANKSLTIICKGNVDKNPANAFPQGSLYLNYDLYHKDFAISAITGNANITHEGFPERKIGLEIFHLRNKDKKMNPALFHHKAQ